MAESILIAEDENSIRRLLKAYFEQENYVVFEAQDGQEALNIFKETKIDLACLDVMMPKLNGFEVAKQIRASSNIPIVILTALGNEENVLKGYSLYVDDYITKPFNPRILLAKVKNLLLRNNNNLVNKEYTIGDLKFDFVNEELWLNNNKINITSTEFKLLAFLVQNANKVCSRELLLDEVWGLDSYVDIRTVDAHVKKIRKLLGPKEYIKTIFGKGYKFEIV